MNPIFKILLVDDEPLLLKTHKRLLGTLQRHLGPTDKIEIHDAEGVTHAYAAVAFAGSIGRQYDLVISDIDMRDGTGFDLLRMIEDKFGRDKPNTIMVSGLVDEQRRLIATQYGSRLYDKFDFGTTVVAAVANMIQVRVLKQ